MKIYFILVILFFSILVRSENHTSFDDNLSYNINKKNSTNNSSIKPNFKQGKAITMHLVNNDSLNKPHTTTNTTTQGQDRSTAFSTPTPVTQGQDSSIAIPTTTPVTQGQDSSIAIPTTTPILTIINEGIKSSGLGVGIILGLAVSIGIISVGVGVCYCRHKERKWPFYSGHHSLPTNNEPVNSKLTDVSDIPKNKRAIDYGRYSHCNYVASLPELTEL